MTIMLRNNRLGLLTALKYRVPDRFESFQWKEIFLWTEEHRKKFRQARLGYKMSEEARAKLSLARKGRKLSQETIDKIAEAQKKICFMFGNR